VELVVLPAVSLDLKLTLGSGQAFHWVAQGEGWLGAIGNTPVYMEQRGAEVFVNQEAAAASGRYLALDHPLEEIYASFPKDPTLQEAAVFCAGMRILRQPAWEAVATFITSSMKQVAHIAQISHTLRRRYGRRLSLGEHTLFAYPEAEALAALEEGDLRACALGYRAKNLLGAAKMVASGEVDLTELAGMADEDAQKELCRLPGVGEKVANCALLFGFERLRSFPVDVWIERVIREKYFPRRKTVTAAQIRTFCAEYFGPYGGYAQQYLFHHARITWNSRRSTAAGSKRGSAKSS
jgi:N-glycosylase/DNA lyase